MSTPPDITLILERWNHGEPGALNELVPVIYKELRHLAASYLRRERHGHTLQPTALINEVFLRLVGERDIKWQSRAHFFGVSARLMRRILIDHARARQAAKRGGAHYSLSLSEADRVADQSAVNLLSLHLALERLSELDPQQGRVVELRFFGGLTIEESAEVLSISHATVEREWRAARAWLRCELSG